MRNKLKYKGGVDSVGERLRQRVEALLQTRPDLQDRAVFGRLIRRPTPSWLSEFLHGKRTTNDLRLVIRMARVFGVSVGYLIGEQATAPDPAVATLIATYESLDPAGRRLLLDMAAAFRRTPQQANASSLEGSGAGDHPTAPNNTVKGAAPQKKKHR